jgi:hypothetical protein
VCSVRLSTHFYIPVDVTTLHVSLTKLTENQPMDPLRRKFLGVDSKPSFLRREDSSPVKCLNDAWPVLNEKKRIVNPSEAR